MHLKITSRITFLGVFTAALAITACGADHHHGSLGSAHQQTQAMHAQQCNIDGVWAVRLDVPVSWHNNGGILSGNGTIVQYVRATRARRNQEVHETLQVCGIELPDYTDRYRMKHGTLFPNELFDAETIPSIKIQSHFTGFDVGDTFTTDMAVIQMGLDMPDAAHAPWPAEAKHLVGVVDHDHNGHPGVTIHAKNTSGYTYPPASVWLAPQNRVKSFHTAIRSITSISATMTSCDQARGTGTIKELDKRMALSSHVVGCELLNGHPCNERQTNFLDSMQQAYRLNGAPVAVLQRLGTHATCADVREALAHP